MEKIILNYQQGASPGTHEKIIELVLKNTTKKIKYTYLDIGSGKGGLINYLLKKRNFKKVYACDIDTSRFELTEIKPIKLDVNKGLPFEDNSIDIITCVEVIEHIENFFFLIREIKRVLKKGGICFLSTPNLNSWYSRVRFLLTGVPSAFDERCYIGSGHINPIFDWNLIRYLDKENLKYERDFNRSIFPYTNIKLPKTPFFAEITIWKISK